MENDLPPSTEPPTTVATSLNLPPMATPFSLSPRKHFTQIQTQHHQEKPQETPTSFFLHQAQGGVTQDTRDINDYSRIPNLAEMDQTQSHVLPPSFALPVSMEDNTTTVHSEYLDSLQTTLDRFWESENLKIESLSPYTDEMYEYAMPLARIKKIMRFDQSVVMIGADAPIILSKACELILREIATRAWYHTNQARRRTVKQSDLNAALALPKTSVFDFLVDFIPREQQLLAAVPTPVVAPPPEPIVEEEEEISDREKSRRDLVNTIAQVAPELSNMELEKGLRLPDVRAPSFPDTKWDELERLSKAKLHDFPKESMPLMLALLRSAFEHTRTSESNKRMKF